MRSRLTLISAGLGLSVIAAACGSTVSSSDAGTSAAPTRAATAATVGVATTAAPATGEGATTVTAVIASMVETVPAAEAAVAGDIPDTQAFVAYSSPSGFSVKVPEGWARSTDGTATVFSDKFNTIRLDTMSMVSAPTVGSVTTTDLPAIALAAKNYKAGKVSVVKRKAGDAVLATYQVDGGANGVTTKIVRLDVERYEFWRNGKSVVITLSSAAGSDNVDPWRIVTDGFGWA